MNPALTTVTSHFSDAAAARATLTSLVLKDGVTIGGLRPPEQAAALALACSALPSGLVLREADVNAALQRFLSQECSFLAIDHVELRRWLVDAGWVTRDGFGREYRRVEEGALSAAHAQVSQALQGMDVREWVASTRAASLAQRDAKRRAWEAKQQSEGPAPHTAARTPRTT